MPKIITAHRTQDEQQQAREYIRRHVLLPSSILGLIFMVAGLAAMLYQFFSLGYGGETFLESLGLLLAGVLIGWAQTRYHHYLLDRFPGQLAGRLRLFTKDPRKRSRKETTRPNITHPGRSLVPLAYASGAALLFAASAVSSMFGHTYYVAAFLIPWIGFFWAKVYFWRSVLVEGMR